MCNVAPDTCTNLQFAYFLRREIKNELDAAIKVMQKKKLLEKTKGVDVIRGVVMDNKTLRPLNK